MREHNISSTANAIIHLFVAVLLPFSRLAWGGFLLPAPQLRMSVAVHSILRGISMRVLNIVIILSITLAALSPLCAEEKKMNKAASGPATVSQPTWIKPASTTLESALVKKY